MIHILYPASVRVFVGYNLGYFGLIKEGDANKFFHGIMSSRRLGNNLNHIDVDGDWVEGVSKVRSVVFSHFAAHFKTLNVDRPVVDEFHTLSHLDGVNLIKPFSMEEVKSVVWDCDNFKSSGPDGVNFSFIKEFWPEKMMSCVSYQSFTVMRGRQKVLIICLLF